MAALCQREFSGPYMQLLGPAMYLPWGEKTAAALSAHEHSVMAGGSALRKATSYQLNDLFS